MLMLEVFNTRMGGEPLPEEYAGAFTNWLVDLPSPKRTPMSDAALRGRDLFVSDEVGCADCHEGARLTNNDTADVGTGAAFQVPSLIGVGTRAPYMHDGCAQTLEERFETWCGGNQHGNVDHLDDEQLADLIAYLETL